MKEKYLVNISGYCISFDALEEVFGELEMMGPAGLQYFEDAMKLIKAGRTDLLDIEEYAAALRGLQFIVRSLKKDAKSTASWQKRKKVIEFDFSDYYQRSRTVHKIAAIQKGTLQYGTASRASAKR
ncbi:MAG: hypothetical protein Q8J69_08635 [Sphingobacteriaceae bacterium]|nr:hypothetical protein [Sphingobacteriaceae bacterium]